MIVAPRPRRRSRPTFVARMRRFWVLFAVAIALAIGIGFALVTTPAFRLHALSVSGLAHVSRNDVVLRAGIDERANIWLLDTRALARRIEELPYVATAKIHRRPLANVWIEISERSADGCVRSPQGPALTVDGSDRVLALGCAAAPARSYELSARTDVAAGHVIGDPELRTLQRNASDLERAGDVFRSLRHDRYGGLEAVLPNGIRVRFGDDRDLERKRKLIGPILAQLGSSATDLRAVDLRAPETPVIEFAARPTGSAQSHQHTQYTQGVHRIHHNM